MFLGIICQIHDHPLWAPAMAELLFLLNLAAIPLFTSSVTVFLALVDPANPTVF
jgi:hypothetical protein